MVVILHQKTWMNGSPELRSIKTSTHIIIKKEKQFILINN